jgi:NTE family protein
MREPVEQATDLVLEGGGVKGIALVGAMSALEAAGYRFSRIAGTSAGAIVGALAAAHLTRGLPIRHVEAVARTLDYRRFRDASWLARLGPPGKVVQLATHEGLYQGDHLVRWLEDQLAVLGVRTFSDLRVPGVSRSAPIQQQYRLVVVAADVSRRKVVALPWDYPGYGRDPDAELVAGAVRASAAIPFYFEPVLLRGLGSGSTSTLVDGGLLWNFPLDIFDSPGSRDPSRTIGIKLSARTVPQPPTEASDGAFELAADCLATLISSHERYHVADTGSPGRIIFVDTGAVSTVDFDISEATQDTLLQAGRSAAETWAATERVSGRVAHRTPWKEVKAK